MAYRNPQFVFLHSWRDAGSSNITTSSESPGFDIERIIDDQSGPLFKWLISDPTNDMEVDRGAGTLEAVDRLLIPSGHDITGNLIFETSTSGVFAGEETQRVNIIAAAGVINESFTSTDDRYHRFRVPNQQSKFGELFVGRDRQTARGPNQQWVDQREPNLVETELRGGNIYRVKAGELRRAFSFTFSRITGTDLAIFDELVTDTQGGLHPFWFFPPDTTEAPVFVKLLTAVNRRQDSGSPTATGQKFEIVLQMVEELI